MPELTAAKEDIIVPAVGKYQKVSVVVAPSYQKSQGARTTRKPAKSGEFDDTVIASLKGLQLEFVADILKHLKKISPAGTAIFAPLSLSKYEHYVHKAAEANGLSKLSITPHSARHGVASVASYLKLLTLDEVSLTS